MQIYNGTYVFGVQIWSKITIWGFASHYKYFNKQYYVAEASPQLARMKLNSFSM